MRRILVPLDGTEMAASILPDAARLAGAQGELVLMRDSTGPTSDYALDDYDSRLAFASVQEYLEQQAERLRAQDLRVRVQTFVMGNIALAIDEAVRIFHVDMIACATHGRNPFGRLVRGSVVWKALAHSQVPVLLRHPGVNENPVPLAPNQRHIMVPLDGSILAEQALPLARDLAREWSATLYLARAALYPVQVTSMSLEARELVTEANDYLQRKAREIPEKVHTGVLAGAVVEALVQAVDEQNITDIVLASHGRTGLARVLLGSVADGLIHRLHLPIVVIPAFAVNYAAHAKRDVESAPSDAASR